MIEQILDLPSTKKILDKIDENAYDLLKKWRTKPEITNDEELANFLGQKITNVRAILNKLNYRGIVVYDKVKDENTGWYNFYWRINYEKLAKIIFQEHKERKEKIKERIEHGFNYDIFSCKNECAYLPFEIAAEYNFICPHCNEKLEFFDYSKKIKELKEELELIEKEMNIIKTIVIKYKQQKQNL